MMLAILCFGGRIQVSEHSDFGIFNNDGASPILTWMYEDTASTAFPAHSSSLAMTFIACGAVMRDADKPCSVKTA